MNCPATICLVEYAGWAQKAQSNKRSSMFVEVYAATATAINLIMRAGQMTPQYLALSLFQ